MTAKFPELTLASGSPRRSAILRQMCIPFQVIVPNIHEQSNEVSPIRYACDIAEKKARSVRSACKTELIVSADTIVYCNATVLTKPTTRRQASEMLHMLSAQSHQVYTAICVLEREGQRCIVDCAKTDVTFARLTNAEIEAYLDTNEWHDVAGGYRIQGIGACLINKIHGENSTVMGLPIRLLYDTLLLLSSGAKHTGTEKNEKER